MEDNLKKRVKSISNFAEYRDLANELERTDKLQEVKYDLSYPIRTFRCGIKMKYAVGKFDGFCVSIEDPTFLHRERIMPKDMRYFTVMKRFAERYGTDKVYGDFLKVYNLVDNTFDTKAFRTIDSIALTYQKQEKDGLIISLLFTILYAAMVSEECKAASVLGKRIKRLGVYVLLFESDSVEYAATFMTGKKVKELGPMCEARGF